jgi:hypothetical protein
MLVIALVPVIVATGGISTSSLGGWTLLVGTNQESDGRFNLADRHLYRQVWGDDRDALAREEALRRIVSDPLGFAALAVRKVHTMWAREYYGVQFALTDAGAPGWIRASARLISQAFYAGVFVAAVLALWQMRRGPPVLAAVILAIVLIVAAVHVFTEVQHRYHAYVVPLLIVLTAWHARAASRSIGGGYAEPSPSDEASTSRWAS